MNKTQAIKDALKSSPSATPTELAAALSKKGVKVTPGRISTVKSTLKAKRKKPAQSSGNLYVEQLRAAIAYRKVVKDPKWAHSWIDVVDELTAD